MAKAYIAKYDVTLPRVISRIERPGQEPLIETESITYPGGSVVLEDNLTPRDKKRAEEGELNHLLQETDVDEAVIHAGAQHEPEFGIFVAEHEAEAHALEQYGHQVVPGDQVLEAQAAGAGHAADYQKRAKEAGLDRRIPQEAMAQQRERVPEELLVGSETRTGTPFNRGPEGHQPTEGSGGEEDSEKESGEASSPAARPRPVSGEQTGD